MIRVPEHLRDFYRMALEQGWTVTVSGGNHLRWNNPDGRRAYTACSPSERSRDRNNVRMKLRKAGLRIEKG